MSCWTAQLRITWRTSGIKKGRGHQVRSNLPAGIKHIYPELADRPWATANRANEGLRSVARGYEEFGDRWEGVICIMELLAQPRYPSHAIGVGMAADGPM